ncbi:helix-turn-helix domain-containing protein [Flavobacterium crassostreae]|uniref:Transcriptional regulator n=1 Tax=Flavobacterium crassostreae TaxID=1763534 RepID=A0A1B9E9G0_9FLAO|nr:helix-turn-helix transcriptional regulator [Flavobacterium crassostreae]OCB78584.1 transcriptional regulator [Flavobacterium crassostreae]
MLNTEDFIKRLEIILEYYGLNASTFADKIGVQRSSLSHLLSGRNKPSLDFVLKILDVYPEVDLYWILNGKGSFPESASTVSDQPALPQTENLVGPSLFDGIEPQTETPTDIPEKKPEAMLPKTYTQAGIDKIVVFYQDGTFMSYVPK